MTKILLGGREFDVPKLPISDLLKLAAILDGEVPQALSGLIDRSAKIVAVALVRIDPSLTDENIRALGVSLDDLNTAVAAIMEVAGFRPSGEAKPAEAGSQISLGISSAALQPDAATARSSSVN